MKTRAPWMDNGAAPARRRAELLEEAIWDWERRLDEANVKLPGLVPRRKLLAWLGLVLFCWAFWRAVLFFAAGAVEIDDVERPYVYRPQMHPAVSVTPEQRPSLEVRP